jgi:predicted RNA-binding Zn-ribbon protein involved in translation (DUF1610 family)
MIKQGNAKLRVCASCEWIFVKNERTNKTGCPKCGFAHYGARFVYRHHAYIYRKTQKPWLDKKMVEYQSKLMKEIEDSMVEYQSKLMKEIEDSKE